MIDICNNCSNRSIFVQKERKSEFRLKNMRNVNINEVKVDNCLIQGHQYRCDWLYEIMCQQVSEVYYVELKGKDLRHALAQILETVNFCEQRFAHRDCKRVACIVLSAYPQENSAIQNKKRELKRKKIELRTSTSKLEIVI